MTERQTIWIVQSNTDYGISAAPYTGYADALREQINLAWRQSKCGFDHVTMELAEKLLDEGKLLECSEIVRTALEECIDGVWITQHEVVLQIQGSSYIL